MTKNKIFMLSLGLLVWHRHVEANEFPVLMIDNQVVVPGCNLTFAVTATDPDGVTNDLRYALLQGPAGASVASNGVFSWSVPFYFAPGLYTSTVQVTDNGLPASLSTNASFVIDVRDHDLQLYLPLNVSTNDLSEYGHNGTLVNAPSWVLGKYGAALWFGGDEKKQYVDVGTFFPSLQRPFTVSLWLKPGTTQSEYADAFGNHGDLNRGMVLQFGGNNNWAFSIGTGVPQRWRGTGYVLLAPDVWQQVTIAVDTNAFIFYLNGAERARVVDSLRMVPNSEYNFRLAQGYQNSPTTRFFKGAIDEFRIYSRTLTTNEIGALMAQPRSTTIIASPTISDYVAFTTNYTRDAAIQLRGTCESNVCVWVNDAGCANQTPTTWSTTRSLTSGMNQFEVVATDTSWDLSETQLVYFVFDTSAPAYSCDPVANAVTNLGIVTVKYSETLSGLDTTASWLRLKNGSDQIVGGTTTFTTNSQMVFTPSIYLQDGTYKVSGALVDRCSNSNGFSYSFTYDSTPPNAPVITNQVVSPTSISAPLFAGTKDTNTSICINGVTKVSRSSTATWSTSGYMLSSGTNTLSFTAVDQAGNVSEPTVVTIMYDNTAPAAVTPTVEENGNGMEVTLFWTGYDEYTAGGDISAYRIYKGGSSFSHSYDAVLVGSTAAGVQTFKATGLQRNTQVYFAVAAQDATGLMNSNVTCVAATPSDKVSPPDSTNLTFACGVTNLVLNWTPSADPDSDLAGYRLYITNSAVPLVSALTNGYTVDGLNPSSAYGFRLTAFDGSSPANESTGLVVVGYTLLPNPTNVTADAHDGYVTLAWDGVQPASNVLHYAIYKALSEFTNVTNLTPVSTTTGLVANAAGLTNGSTNWFAVTTVNRSGGQDSEVIAVAAVARDDSSGPALTNLTWQGAALPNLVTNAGTFSVTAGDESAVSRVEFRIGGTLLTTVQSGRRYSAYWNVYNTTNDGPYTLEITACDSRGNETVETHALTLELAAPAAPALTSPADGAVVAKSSQFVEGTAGTGASTVSIYVNGSVSVVGDVSLSGTFKIAVALADGTNTLSAKALNNRGNAGDFSASSKVILDTSVPGTPVGLTATPAADGKIRLGWFAPSAGATVKSYEVYRAAASFSGTDEAARIASGLSDVSYTDIPDGTGPYYYRVRAMNIVGTFGALSSEASATADCAAPLLVSLAVASDGPSNAADRRFGLGKLALTLTVSEPLSAVPFLIIIPSGGTPRTVTLTAAGERQYTGALTVTDSTKSGMVGLSFSARDAVGNWGTDVAAGCAFTIDTTGPQVSAVNVVPSSPINNSQSNALVQVTLEFPSGDIPVETPTLAYTLSKSQTQSRTVTLQSVSGSANTWLGQLTLPGSAGSESEALVFQYTAKDDLGNVGSGTHSVQVYQGDLPPLSPPSGLTAVSLPRGAVRLSWNAVESAESYVLAHGLSSNAVSAFAETAILVYTNTPAAVTNWYSAASVYSANGQTSTSDWCAAVCAVSDAGVPSAPTNLTLSAVGAGVGLVWSNTANESVTFRVYRSAETFGSVTGMTVLAGGVAALKATDAAPLSGDAFYAVTAVDAAGNESDPSECKDINVRLVPVASLSVDVENGGYPVLSWTHPGSGGVIGCNIYVDGVLNSGGLPWNGSRVDRGDSGATRSYGVEVYSESYTCAPPRTVVLPAVGFAPLSANSVNRGIMNRLWFSVTNAAAFAVSNLTLHVEIGGKDHASSACVVPARSVTNLSVIVGGYASLKEVEPVTNRLSIVAETGEVVNLRTTGWQTVGDAPLVAEIRNDEFIRGGAGKACFFLRNTSSEEVELVMAENGGASSEIRFVLETSDGVALSEAPVLQTLNGVVNFSGKSLARIPAGGEFTSEYTSIDVPDLAGSGLVLVLEIDKIRWHTGCSDQLAIDGAAARTTVTLTDTAYAARALSAVPQVSYGDEPIVITGVASNRTTGAAKPNAQVKAIVSTAGFSRQATVLTDSTGVWTYSFQPLSTEGGIYQVCAVHPDVTAKPDQGVSFIVNRLAVSPSFYTITALRNYLQTVPLTVTARAGVSLTNLTVALLAEDQPSKTLPAGIAVTNLVALPVLTAGQSGTLKFGISADNGSADTVSVVVRVTGDGAPAGGWALVTCSCTFEEAVPYLDFSVSYVETGVARGGYALESLDLKNIGYAAAENVRLSLVNANGTDVPAWLKLGGTTAFSEFSAGATSAVMIACSPDTGVAGERYELSLKVTADNLAEKTIPVYIGVDDTGKGGAVFQVTDLYTGTTNASGNFISGVSGVNIRLIKDTGSTIITNLVTSFGGVAEVTGLPVGSYKVVATAGKHTDYSDRIWIKPGVMVQKDIWMDCQLVTVEWSVVPTTIKDKYEIVLTTTYETDVPAAVVVLDPALVLIPDMEVGDVYNGELRLINYGLIQAKTESFTFPGKNVGDFSFERLADVPAMVNPNEEVVIPYRITRVADGSLETGAGDASSLRLVGSSGSGSGGGASGSPSANYKYTDNCKGGAASAYWVVYGNGVGAGPDAGGGGGILDSSYCPMCGGNGGVVLTPATSDSVAGSIPCKGPCDDAKNPECCKKINSEVSHSSVDRPMGRYLDDAVDLGIKTQGHTVRFSRTFDDTSWTFDLQTDRLTWLSGGDNSGDLTMFHNGMTYTRQRGVYDARGKLGDCALETYGGLYYNSSSGDRIAVNYDHVTNGVSAVLQGFSLVRTSGRSVEYDAAGRLISRRNRSGARLFFGYTDGRLTGVFDHHTNQVLWITCDGANGQPSRVSDAATGGGGR